MICLDRIEIESVGSDPIRLAEALLDQLLASALPAPIYDIARALDIVSIHAKPMVGMEGCLQCDPRKSEGQIIVNSESSLARQRFTVAHELGHFLNERHFPTDGSEFVCTKQDLAQSPSQALGIDRRARQENEANCFAVEVLAPRRHIRLGQEVAIDHAFGLAATFQISREAAVRRYVELHPLCLAAVFSHKGRVRAVAKGRNFPQTRIWNDDVLPGLHEQQAGHPAQTPLCEADPSVWLSYPGDAQLLAQTAFQRDEYATTLLVVYEAHRGLADDTLAGAKQSKP